MYRTRIQSVTFYSPVFSNDYLKQVHCSTDTNPHTGCSLSDVLQEPMSVTGKSLMSSEIQDFYCNFTLSKLICTHCSTLDSCHSMIKHLQQSACSHLQWVPNNNCLSFVISLNISYFLLLSLVFHYKQLQEESIQSS